MSSTPLMFAAALTIIVGIVHSWLGERRLITPLLAPGHRHSLLASSAYARHVLRGAWHFTTLILWGIAAILVILALSPLAAPARTIVATISILFAISGVFSLTLSRGRHVAWPLFFAISASSAAPLFLAP